MKPFLILILLTFSFTEFIFSQDYIYPLKADRIKCKVLEIGSESIKYKKVEQPDGPIRIISIKDVFMIIYEDGTKEVINPIVSEQEKNQTVKTESSKSNKPTSSSTNTIKTKNKEKKKGNFDFDFGLGTGIFIPYNKGIGKIYKVPLNPFEINWTWWIRKVAPRLDINYMYKKGIPIIIGNVKNPNCDIIISSITISALFRSAKDNVFHTYYGVGMGINSIVENLRGYWVSYDSNGEEVYTRFDNQVRANAYNFNIIGGFKVKFMFLELKLNSSKIGNSSGAAGKNANFGGFWLTTGFRF